MDVTHLQSGRHQEPGEYCVAPSLFALAGFWRCLPYFVRSRKQRKAFLAATWNVPSETLSLSSSLRIRGNNGSETVAQPSSERHFQANHIFPAKDKNWPGGRRHPKKLGVAEAHLPVTPGQDALPGCAALPICTPLSCSRSCCFLCEPCGQGAWRKKSV